MRAASSAALRRDCPELHERTGDLLHVRFADAASSVLYLKAERPLLAGGVWVERGAYLYEALFRELDGIADEVERNLAESMRIEH